MRLAGGASPGQRPPPRAGGLHVQRQPCGPAVRGAVAASPRPRAAWPPPAALRWRGRRDGTSLPRRVGGWPWEKGGSAVLGSPTSCSGCPSSEKALGGDRVGGLRRWLLQAIGPGSGLWAARVTVPAPACPVGGGAVRGRSGGWVAPRRWLDSRPPPLGAKWAASAECCV